MNRATKKQTGGKPVTAVPGLTPRSPVITLGPVLVTVEAPSTAKLWAIPSDGAVWAAAEWYVVALTSATSKAMDPILIDPAVNVRMLRMKPIMFASL
jgi:hypothetical protein